MSARKADTNINVGKAEGKAKEDQGNVNHHTTCDGCKQPIYGLRHKCMGCSEFDYCSECVQKAARNHPGHRFETLFEPESRKPVSENGGRVRGDDSAREGSRSYGDRSRPERSWDAPGNHKPSPSRAPPKSLSTQSRTRPVKDGEGRDQGERTYWSVSYAMSIDHAIDKHGLEKLTIMIGNDDVNQPDSGDYCADPTFSMMNLLGQSLK